MPDTETVAMLSKARELVEGGWCQRVPALDANGDRAPYWREDAAAFCVTGALYRASMITDAGGESWHRAIRSFYEAIKDGVAAPLRYDEAAITAWNDYHGRTSDEVLAAFGRAIRYAEESDA